VSVSSLGLVLESPALLMPFVLLRNVDVSLAKYRECLRRSDTHVIGGAGYLRIEIVQWQAPVTGPGTRRDEKVHYPTYRVGAVPNDHHLQLPASFASLHTPERIHKQDQALTARIETPGFLHRYWLNALQRGRLRHHGLEEACPSGGGRA